jgi:hypothetical protein
MQLNGFCVAGNTPLDDDKDLEGGIDEGFNEAFSKSLNII